MVSVSAMAQSFEYKVVELREGIVGGKMSGDKLEKTLNEHGRQGWQLKAVTAVEIKGRIGPGGVEGVLVTFERQKGYPPSRRFGSSQVTIPATSFCDPRPLVSRPAAPAAQGDFRTGQWCTPVGSLPTARRRQSASQRLRAPPPESAGR